MDKKEKLGAFNQLLNEKYYEADYELLKKEDPRHDVFKNPSPTPAQYREALFALLDQVDADQVKKHRKAWLKKKEAAKARRKAQQEKAAKEKAKKEEQEKAAKEKGKHDAGGDKEDDQEKQSGQKKEEQSGGEEVKKNPENPGPRPGSKKSKNTPTSGGTGSKTKTSK